MPDAFLADLAFVLEREGGYVNDPDDPGGATNQGITQRTYDRYRRRLRLPVRDVRQVTVEEVRDLYRTNYYQPAGGTLTEPLALIAFDTAVNMGVGEARRLLFISKGSPDQFIELRRQEYHHIVAGHPPLAKFLPGWLQRLRALRKRCKLPVAPVLETDFAAARKAA